LYVRDLDAQQWKWLETLGKSAIIGTFHFGSVDRRILAPGMADVGSESNRGLAYVRYVRSTRPNPYSSDATGSSTSISR
jgi:hypothetical protein